jgi:hypothetical protein
MQITYKIILINNYWCNNNWSYYDKLWYDNILTLKSYHIMSINTKYNFKSNI